MSYTAKWIDGYASLHGKADANKIAAEIMDLGEGVKPEQIVDKARDDATELHKCFEWDDTKAAEQYRVQQARQVVCHLVIEKADAPAPEAQEVRYFYKTDGQSGYKSTEYIFTHADEYELLLSRARAELQSFKAKYATLKELKPIIDLIA